MENVIQLVAKDGTLYFPYGGFAVDSFKRVAERPALLLRLSPAGDFDIVPWPFTKTNADAMLKRLACALYDERECNEFFPVDAKIALPNGEVFNFDAYVE